MATWIIEMTVHYEPNGRVVVLRVDNPPVNALSHGVRVGLLEGLQRAQTDAAVDAVVVIGAGRTYMAGADLKEFGRPKEPPLLGDVQAAMEASTKPIVSAIHGTALGGGLEVALCGHWRVASADARLGLPEVKLGLTPGAGGIQRMTRLAGPQAALEIILSGDAIDAAHARTLGVIDEVVPGDLLAGAIAFAQRVVQERRPLRIVKHLQDAIADVDDETFELYRRRSHEATPGLLAPGKIIACVEAACRLPVEDAFRFDAECYRECLGSPQREAMIHLFFAERAARKAPTAVEKGQAVGSRKVFVIGEQQLGPWFSGRLESIGVSVACTPGWPMDDACTAADAIIDARTDAQGADPVRSPLRADRIVRMHLTTCDGSPALLEVVWDDAMTTACVALATAIVTAVALPALWVRRRSLVQRMRRHLAGTASPEPQAQDEDDSLATLLHPLAQEGARALEDGMAMRASDIDVACIHGLGLPRWRGGPMFWASQSGIRPDATPART